MSYITITGHKAVTYEQIRLTIVVSHMRKKPFLFKQIEQNRLRRQSENLDWYKTT